MKITKSEVLQFVEENDVKFVRLAFFDIKGTMKNISIISSELTRAFETGIVIDASSIGGFSEMNMSDVFLHPEPSTLVVLPWRPAQGRVIRLFCHVKDSKGEMFLGDCRNILETAVKHAKEDGYSVKMGTECEFYLFMRDENGNPTHVPHDRAGYFDIAPLDKGENIRRDICLTLEEMGIEPKTSHHESGPGQNEIDFQYSGALNAADNLQSFKSIVKTIAAQNGVFASFLPHPIKDNCSSGLHINVSLISDGVNIFSDVLGDKKTAGENFLAGVLKRLREITFFLNPIVNSYERIGKGEVPTHISWSEDNRFQVARIPCDDGILSRMELRSPDPACNPYIAFALIIEAGLEGIRNQEKLPEAVTENLFDIDDDKIKNLEKLPTCLEEAIEIAENSEFVLKHIDERFLKTLTKLKRDEIKSYNADEFYDKDCEYFIKY